MISRSCSTEEIGFKVHDTKRKFWSSSSTCRRRLQCDSVTFVCNLLRVEKLEGKTIDLATRTSQVTSDPQTSDMTEERKMQKRSRIANHVAPEMRLVTKIVDLNQPSSEPNVEVICRWMDDLMRRRGLGGTFSSLEYFSVFSCACVRGYVLGKRERERERERTDEGMWRWWSLHQRWRLCKST